MAEPSVSPQTAETDDAEDADTPEPRAKVRRLSSPAKENDGATCPICLEPWTTRGEHRLVSLKCGHLFGAGCVERWLRGKVGADGCCPTCKTRATLRQMRPIYATHVVAVDTAELTALKKQLEVAQMERNTLEIELQTTRLQHRAALSQLELLTRGAEGGAEPRPRGGWRFTPVSNQVMGRDGGCRVLAYDERTQAFYVSQKSTNRLFPGYGVRTVSAVDRAHGPFTPLHQKPIRGAAYSQPAAALLTVGLDGVARILRSGHQADTVRSRLPLWSCAWDHARPHQFYVGSVGGLVMWYDTRNTRDCVDSVTMPGDMSPTISLASTKFGLLACQLKTAWLCREAAPRPQPQPLPVKGPFVSLCYEAESQRAVASCRPAGGGGGRTRLSVLRLAGDPAAEVTVDCTQTISGSARATVMSRAAFLKVGETTWVAAYSESEAALQLHPLEGGRALALPAAEPALDVCAGRARDTTVLATLSESRLRMYVASPTDPVS